MAATFAHIRTPEEYTAALTRHCLSDDVKDIGGIDRETRFERLFPEHVSLLSQYCLDNAGMYAIEIASPKMALHILGAREVDPAKEAYNLVLGKGADKVHYWCSKNEHNRMLKKTNLGTPEKEGIVFDISSGYFAVGPMAHIDSWGCILSLQHRLIAWLAAYGKDEKVSPITLLTLIGMPPQLAATLDRGASKTGRDQEFIDRSKFQRELILSEVETVPDDLDLVKVRNELSGFLFTARNNIWSRMNGTGYHPSKKAQPSTREALGMEQDQFAACEHGNELERLIVQCYWAMFAEDGTKRLWVKYFPLPMIVTAIVLASNRNEDWSPGDKIVVDQEITEDVLGLLSKASDSGTDNFSRYVAEVAKIKAQAKKPSPMDRWTFYGLVTVLDSELSGEDYEGNAFPTPAKMKKGKNPTIFGGMDSGPREDSDE